MSDDLEQQTEELDVLESIYSDDAFFTKVTPTCFQFKYGTEGSGRSFVLQFRWPPTYPSCAVPLLSLELFYNKHLQANVRENILERVNAEATENLGMASTFTLVEYIKDNLQDILADQPETMTRGDDKEGTPKDDKPNAKNTQLTKSQKRRMWDKGGLGDDEKVRGWNWVDVLQHISKTGGAPE